MPVFNIRNNSITNARTDQCSELSMSSFKLGKKDNETLSLPNKTVPS